MNKDELMNLVPILVALLAPVGVKYGFSAGDLTAFLTGLVGIGVGIYMHWNLKKVPESSVAISTNAGLAPPVGKVVTGTVVGSLAAIGLTGALLCPGTGHAANLPPPVLKAPLIQTTPCTVTSCTGLVFGANIANAGGNFDVVGTGLSGLASNGVGMGGQFGYEFWNGQLYAAILAVVDYDISLKAPGSGISDKFTWGAVGRVGYSLASAFGAATTAGSTPTLPQQFTQSLMTPYLNVGEVRRHNQPALVSGAGVEALIATNWTLNADYFHYTYNQGGSAGTPLPTGVTKQTDDNEFRLSINRHFGF